MFNKMSIRDSAFHKLLTSTSDMIFVKDANLTYVASSTTFARMAGKNSIDEVIGKTDFDIFDDPELAKRYTSDDRKLFSAGKDLVDYVEPLADNNGKARYSSTSKYILRDNNGGIIGLIGISKDITREYMAQLNHQQELQYMFELPEDVYSAVFIDIDDWRIVGQRLHAVRGFSMPTHDDIDDMVDNALRSIPSDEAVRSFFLQFSQDTMRSIYRSGRRSISMEYLRHTSQDDDRWVRIEAKYLTDPSNGHLCSMFFIRDIDEEKRETMELLQAANTDEMTGLLNRAATMHSIESFLAASGPDDSHALFMIDIDNFKTLNDTFGHMAGDEFLTSIAREIKHCFRDSDVVGRIGGDEFFALMKNVPDMTAVADKAGDLLHAMRNVCNMRSSAQLSGTIGISVYGIDGHTLEELYEKADNAMYTAKRLGKNRFALASELK